MRIEAIDLARGLALVAMAAYHTLWDATYFGFINIGIGVDPVWIGIQRAILVAFLFLVGVSLALSHRDGIIWRRFWRRFALIAAAGLVMTVATWFAFGEYFSYFGVLSAIALFSLMALPLIRAPLWVAFTVAAIFFLLPMLFNAPAFDAKWLSWIGFFVTTPATADLVPVFPWFGVVALGVIAVRLFRPRLPLLAALSFGDPVSRGLKLIGRWSLVFYLVHQPVILAVLYPLAMLRSH